MIKIAITIDEKKLARKAKGVTAFTLEPVKPTIRSKPAGRRCKLSEEQVLQLANRLQQGHSWEHCITLAKEQWQINISKAGLKNYQALKSARYQFRKSQIQPWSDDDNGQATTANE